MMESNPQNLLITIFEFNSNPEEKLEEAIKWAENYIYAKQILLYE